MAVPTDADGNGVPDGNYLAWAIVDLASDFEPHDINYFGPTEHFGWYKRFLVAYAKAVRGDMAALLGHDVRQGSGLIQADAGYDPAWRQQYQEYYGPRNPWMMRRPDLLTPGTVVTSQGI